VFPKIVIPQNGWCIRENPIKMDDLGVPLFSETPIYYLVIFSYISLPSKDQQLIDEISNKKESNQKVSTHTPHTQKKKQFNFFMIQHLEMFLWSIVSLLVSKLVRVGSFFPVLCFSLRYFSPPASMNVSRLKRCNETRLMESEAEETVETYGVKNGDGKISGR